MTRVKNKYERRKNLIFKSTKNTRPLLSDSLKYIRSDLPVSVTEAEVEWLLSNNITTVIDLRTDREREAKPCPLMLDSRFDYRVYPLSGGDTIPKSPDDVSASYIAMVDGVFDSALSLLLNSQNGVLYFCTVGKDRTGVLSAALLYRLGFARDYVVADYMKSRDNLLPELTSLATKNPEIDLAVITPTERYITEFLEWYAAEETPLQN